MVATIEELRTHPSPTQHQSLWGLEKVCNCQGADIDQIFYDVTNYRVNL